MLLMASRFRGGGGEKLSVAKELARLSSTRNSGAINDLYGPHARACRYI